MGKFRFTIRFFAILLALPVLMFAELTREDATIKERKNAIEVKSSNASVNANLVCLFPLLQASSN